jgi:hypothetical protein
MIVKFREPQPSRSLNLMWRLNDTLQPHRVTYSRATGLGQ